MTDTNQYQLENSKLGKVTRGVANTLAVPTFLMSPLLLTSGVVSGIHKNVDLQGLTEKLGHTINNPAVGETFYKIGAWGFGMGATVAVIASIVAGFGLTFVYVERGLAESDTNNPRGFDGDLRNFMRGIENRRRNKSIELSDAVRDTHGSLGSSLIGRSVRSRFGNPEFTYETEEGDLVRTPRGFALVDDEEVVAYGRSKSKFVHGHAIEEEDKVHILYGTPSQFVGGPYAKQEFRLLTADKGTIQDGHIAEIHYRFDQPFVSRESIEGKPSLTIREYQTFGTSGAFAAYHDVYVLNPETRKLERKRVDLISSDTEALTRLPKSKELLEQVVGVSIPDGYNPSRR